MRPRPLHPPSGCAQPCGAARRPRRRRTWRSRRCAHGTAPSDGLRITTSCRKSRFLAPTAFRRMIPQRERHCAAGGPRRLRRSASDAGRARTLPAACAACMARHSLLGQGVVRAARAAGDEAAPDPDGIRYSHLAHAGQGVPDIWPECYVAIEAGAAAAPPSPAVLRRDPAHLHTPKWAGGARAGWCTQRCHAACGPSRLARRTTRLWLAWCSSRWRPSPTTWPARCSPGDAGPPDDHQHARGRGHDDGVLASGSEILGDDVVGC